MNRLVIYIFLCLTPLGVNGQEQSIDVAEITLKVGLGGKEELYYSFAAGDRIVFNFEEVKGKVLKEIEITELPSNSKFMDFKTASIVDKKITVHKKGVYRFSFKNGSPKGRICKIKIQRIPATPELASFSTDWKWKTVYDTTFTPYIEDSLIGYDTTYKPYKKKELVSVDTTYIVKKLSPTIHTKLNVDGDKAYVKFDLPNNTYLPLRGSKVISWAYYFSTSKKNPRLANIASGTGKVIARLHPLGAVALGLASVIISNSGDNINYYLVKGYDQASAFKSGLSFMQYDKGDASMAAHRIIDSPLQGTMYLCFDNDKVFAQEVYVRFTAVVVTKTYERKEYQKMITTPEYVTLNKVKMNVRSSKIRVTTG